MRKYPQIILFFFLLIGSVQVFGQSDSLSSPTPRLQLVHADSLVSISRDNEEITEVIGNVEFIQGDAYMLCDRAILWQQTNRTRLRGHVVIYDGKRTLKADRVDYDGEQRIEKAAGHVVFESKNRKLTANRLDYHQQEEWAEAIGDVTFQDLDERTSVKGRKAYYDRKKDYGYVEGDPQLTKADSTSGELFVIDGLKIEAWGSENRAVVTDSVRITKGDLTAHCMHADYRPDEHILYMNGNPIIWHRDFKMQGDSIDVTLNDTQFTGGLIRGKARIVSKDSTHEDVLTGNHITISVDQDTIRNILVEGQASSVYNIRPEEKDNSTDEGVNSVTGDRIVLIFKDEKLSRVRVLSEPGQCMGTYKPKNDMSETKTEGKSQ